MNSHWKVRYGVDPVKFGQEVLGFEADAKQRLILESSARRVLLCCSRQWGKTTVAGVAALHRACFYPKSGIVVASSSERQSGLVVRKTEEFAAQMGLRLRGDGENRISLVFPNGSRMVALPAKQRTIRGFSASLLLIDEAAQTPDRIYEAVRPMLAATNGALWLMSTPYGKRGFFYEEWVRGGDKWLRVSVPATECERIPARFLEEERATVGDRKFRQEYMCEFVQGDDALFRQEDIDACLDEEMEAIF